MNDKTSPIVTDINRPVLVPPGGHKKVLLHSCCAPCSGEVMEAMLASGIDYTIYFYNPNIHPLKEYMLRKEENMRFADKFGIPFIDKDDDYENDRKEWFAKAKGMEFEPERGIRCTMCFDMRFEKAAQYAHENGYTVVRELAGHGVGNDFHEEPIVDHYDTRHKGMLLVPGMVFTIEPMLNLGARDVFIDEEDGWTVVTEDELPSAQWEHTFLVTETGLEILTY